MIISNLSYVKDYGVVVKKENIWIKIKTKTAGKGGYCGEGGDRTHNLGIMMPLLSH
jgi:hypothetical protein